MADEQPVSAYLAIDSSGPAADSLSQIKLGEPLLLSGGAESSSSSPFADGTGRSLSSGLSVRDETTGTGSSLSTTIAQPPLSSAELAGVIVAVALVAIGVVAFIVWFHLRRRKSKPGEQNGIIPPRSTPGPVQISVISTDSRPSASRQNSLGAPIGVYRGEDSVDEESFTDYGSIVGSFPPSPTPSFRSAIDVPHFSRSRSGTGTSFGTVASFGSHRSRVSATASFHTCIEEDFN